MADPLISPLVTWLARLLTGQTTGADLTVPPTTFRADRFGAETLDDAYPHLNIERTLAVRYVGQSLRPFAGDCRRKLVELEVRVSYRYELDLAAVGNADAQARTDAARLRSADDAAFLTDLMNDPANYGAATNGAVVTDVRPGAHTIDDQGAGAFDGVLPVTLEASYDPRSLSLGTAAP